MTTIKSALITAIAVMTEVDVDLYNEEIAVLQGQVDKKVADAEKQKAIRDAKNADKVDELKGIVKTFLSKDNFKSAEDIVADVHAAAVKAGLATEEEPITVPMVRFRLTKLVNSGEAMKRKEEILVPGKKLQVTSYVLI